MRNALAWLNWVNVPMTIETPKSQLQALIEATEFAAGAIEDAIYLEDGLDGAAGEATLKMLRDANPTIPERPRRIWEEVCQRSRELQDRVSCLESALRRLHLLATGYATMQAWNGNPDRELDRACKEAATALGI